MSEEFANAATTFGILFPGELGSSLGRALSQAGYRVVTSTTGRSDRTKRLCKAAQLETLPSIASVVSASDIVLSTVTQQAAVGTASAFCETVGLLHSVAPTYVDLNSISPQIVTEIGRQLSHVGAPFIDASLHGSADRLTNGAVIYLSGENASRLQELLSSVFCVRILEDKPGAASAFKLLIGGLNKGLVSLFLEMSLIARETQMLGEFLDRCGEYYPEITVLIERLLPTYPRHALRRAQEMAALDEHAASLGMRSSFARASRSLLEELGAADFDSCTDDHAVSSRSIRALIELIAGKGGICQLEHVISVSDRPADANSKHQ